MEEEKEEDEEDKQKGEKDRRAKNDKRGEQSFRRQRKFHLPFSIHHSASSPHVPWGSAFCPPTLSLCSKRSWEREHMHTDRTLLMYVNTLPNYVSGNFGPPVKSKFIQVLLNPHPEIPMLPWPFFSKAKLKEKFVLKSVGVVFQNLLIPCFHIILYF